jgi:hypothetical protein
MLGGLESTRTVTEAGAFLRAGAARCFLIVFHSVVFIFTVNLIYTTYVTGGITFRYLIVRPRIALLLAGQE